MAYTNAALDGVSDFDGHDFVAADFRWIFGGVVFGLGAIATAGAIIFAVASVAVWIISTALSANPHTRAKASVGLQTIALVESDRTISGVADFPNVTGTMIRAAAISDVVRHVKLAHATAPLAVPVTDVPLPPRRPIERPELLALLTPHAMAPVQYETWKRMSDGAGSGKLAALTPPSRKLAALTPPKEPASARVGAAPFPPSHVLKKTAAAEPPPASPPRDAAAQAAPVSRSALAPAQVIKSEPVTRSPLASKRVAAAAKPKRSTPPVEKAPSQTKREIARAPVAPHLPKAPAAPPPKVALATPPAPAPARKKRVALQPARSRVSLPRPDSYTAVYDIAAHTVYMPNGVRLEAHSGLGNKLDNPRYVSVKDRGPTPPNVYALSLRKQLFHGVRAIRLNPVGGGKMYGRDGMLAHTYMLGPGGQSFGCVSFKNYSSFLHAYLSGEVKRLVVVAHLDATPSSIARTFRDPGERYAFNVIP